MSLEDIEEEVWDEKTGWKKVEKLPPKHWKLIVQTREATKEIEPITLADATKLSKCLLRLGEPIAMTKIIELKEVV
jgi:hypothetical protein